MQTNRRVSIKYVSYYYFVNECINLSKLGCCGNVQFVPASVREQGSPHAFLWISRAERGGMWSGVLVPNPHIQELEGKCQQLRFLTIPWNSFEECRI